MPFNFLTFKNFDQLRVKPEGENLSYRRVCLFVYRCKIKLAASLARCRVKQSLQSISCFLSDPVRSKQHRAKQLPLYAWVNTLRSRYTQTNTAMESLLLIFHLLFISEKKQTL